MHAIKDFTLNKISTIKIYDHLKKHRKHSRNHHKGLNVQTCVIMYTPKKRCKLFF